MKITKNSLADLVQKVILEPNEIQWSDIRGVELHKHSWTEPTYETMTFLNRQFLPEEQMNYYENLKAVPSCLNDLFVWTESYVFYVPTEFSVVKIPRNPVDDYLIYPFDEISNT